MKLGFLTDGRTEDVEFAADAGFDCLELALFGDTPLFQDHHDFAAALPNCGLSVAAVSLFGQNYFDPERGSGNVDRLRRTFDLAAALHAPVVVFGTGTPPGRSHHERAVNALEKVVPLAQEAQQGGLRVALYNCHWENWIDRPEAWHVALPHLPGVGIKFDPSHPVQDRRDWKAELLEAGPHLMHAHAKDVLEVGGKFIADPNPGLGDIRWENFFGILYHVGYEGAVCIEPHSARYTGEDRHAFLRLSAHYLRQFMMPRFR
ncbi:MAG: sugar phosphate isomerase/epimerase [Armatimonadaceae bacterium]